MDKYLLSRVHEIDNVLFGTQKIDCIYLLNSFVVRVVKNDYLLLLNRSDFIRRVCVKYILKILLSKFNEIDKNFLES